MPPDTVDLQYGEALRPAVAGDSIVWAVPVAFERAPRGAVIYVRHRGRWTFEHLPALAVASVELGWSPTTGLLAAVTRPDPTEPRDRNSLFVYAHDSAWRMVQRVARGGDEGAYAPQWASTRDGLVLGWTQGGKVLSATFVGISPTTPLEHFEQRHLWPVFVAGPHGLTIWLSQHRLGDGVESRITAIDGTRVLTLGSYPGGGFNVMNRLSTFAAVPGRELLVIGYAFDSAGGRPRLFTRLVEARIDCTSAAR